MTIGDRIRSIRKSKGIGQTELATAIGVSKQSLYKYETNIIASIPSDKIESIARYLDVSPAVIMGWENNSEKDEEYSNSESSLTDGEKMMLDLFRQIPEDRQPEALDLLRVALKMQKKH